MRIDILTLFPEACEPFFASSIIGRAQSAGKVTIKCHNIRAHSTDPHRKVDDVPFGGGPGMVMMCQPIFDAVETVTREDPRGPTLILMTPQGRRLTQRVAEELATKDRLILIAGHYEGVDERVRIGLSPLELSVGDYVLSGGESAAMVAVDAIVRLLPDVLGHPDSSKDESFSRLDEGGEQDAGVVALEYPQYTRPREFRGLTVPPVLLGGNHGQIRQWRREESLRRTAERRPDLLEKKNNGTD